MQGTIDITTYNNNRKLLSGTILFLFVRWFGVGPLVLGLGSRLCISVSLKHQRGHKTITKEHRNDIERT